MDGAKQASIRVGQVFLNKVSFSHSPEALALPSNTPLPESQVEVSVYHGLSPDCDKGFVKVRVASAQGPSAFYLYDLEMLALFELEAGAGNVDLAAFVGSNGTAFLFPFVREAVASITQRGRFGPIWLNPINLSTLSKSSIDG